MVINHISGCIANSKNTKLFENSRHDSVIILLYHWHLAMSENYKTGTHFVLIENEDIWKQSKW